MHAARIHKPMKNAIIVQYKTLSGYDKAVKKTIK